MKTFFSTTLFLLIIMLFSACSASYKAVYPISVWYPSADSDFAYKFDVLKEAGNTRLSRKEERRHIRVVAVKQVNNTGRTIQYGDDFLFYAEDKEADVIPAYQAACYLKKSAPARVLNNVLLPLKHTIIFWNKHHHGKANRNLSTEMERNTIIGRKINDGETFFGLIAVYQKQFLPLTVKMCN